MSPPSCKARRKFARGSTIHWEKAVKRKGALGLQEGTPSFKPALVVQRVFLENRASTDRLQQHMWHQLAECGAKAAEQRETNFAKDAAQRSRHGATATSHAPTTSSLTTATASSPRALGSNNSSTESLPPNIVCGPVACCQAPLPGKLATSAMSRLDAGKMW